MAYRDSEREREYHRWYYRQNKLPYLFRSQQKDAKRRGIPFLLTFDQWLEVWVKSGRLKQRGRYAHQYQMCRLDDQGAYELGNVFIQTCRRNRAAQIPHRRGAANNRNSAKLTILQVDQIRLLKGQQTAPKVARKYSVSLGSIYNIWAGRAWRAERNQRTAPNT